MVMVASGLEADRMDQMKCYVCYYTYDMGNSYPIVIFWYRKDAELWVKERETVDGVYKEMEIK